MEGVNNEGTLSVLSEPDPFGYYYRVWHGILGDYADEVNRRHGLSGRLVKLVGFVVTDAFFLHYDVKPKLVEGELDELRNVVRTTFQEYMAGDEYRRVTILTRMNKTLSTFYAKVLTEELIARLKAMAPQEQQELERLVEQVLTQTQCPSCQSGVCPIHKRGQQGGQSTSPSQHPQQGSQQSTAQQLGGQISEATRRALEALKQAVKQAAEQAARQTQQAAEVSEIVEEAAKEEEAMTRRGVGRSPLQLADAVARIMQLRRAVDILALGRHLARQWMRKRFERGLLGEPFSVKRSNRIEDALPSQLAEPEELFLARLADGSLLTLERGEERIRDIVLVLDFSGSMEDVVMGLEKHEWVKAAVVAIWKMAHRKARIRVILFNYGPVRELELRGLSALTELLRFEPDGGTEFVSTLRRAADVAATMRKPNVVFVSDGEAPLPRNDAIEIARKLKSIGAVFSALFVLDQYVGQYQGEAVASAKLIARETGGTVALLRDIVTAAERAVTAATRI